MSRGFSQSKPKSHNFVHNIRVHRTYAHHSTGIFQAQARGHLQSIIIPVLDEDVSFVQLLRYRAGMHRADLETRAYIQCEGAGWHRLLRPLPIRNTINRHPRRLLQDVQQCPAQFEFITADGKLHYHLLNHTNISYLPRIIRHTLRNGLGIIQGRSTR